MILSDLEIIREMWQDKIVVTPILNIAEQLGACTLDLRLGPDFIIKEPSKETTVDPVELRARASRNPASIDRMYRLIKRINPNDAFVLHPGEFALGSTLEYVGLADDVGGILEGRSTWAREGLNVHSTASFIHPGSRGVITFELENSGRIPIRLYVGSRIAQIMFFRLSVPPAATYARSNSKYLNYLTTNYGRPWLDPEYDVLSALHSGNGRTTVAAGDFGRN